MSRIGVAVVFTWAAAGAQAQLVPFQATFEGTVNGGTLEATGGGQLDIDQTGRSEASIDFGAIPESFNPLAASLISNLCSNAFRADGGSENLWDLAQGDYHVSRTFQWVGLPGSMLTIESAVSNVDGMVSSNSTLSGMYDGPTDIVGFADYSVTWLPSSAESEFFEAGTVVLERANGEQLIMLFASVFSGLDGGLTEPQTGVGMFDTSFDGTTLSLGWDGEFEVVPSPASLGLLLTAGVMAGRRRRS